MPACLPAQRPRPWCPTACALGGAAGRRRAARARRPSWSWAGPTRAERARCCARWPSPPSWRRWARVCGISGIGPRAWTGQRGPAARQGRHRVLTHRCCAAPPRTRINRWTAAGGLLCAGRGGAPDARRRHLHAHGCVAGQRLRCVQQQKQRSWPRSRRRGLCIPQVPTTVWPLGRAPLCVRPPRCPWRWPAPAPAHCCCWMSWAGARPRTTATRWRTRCSAT